MEVSALSSFTIFAIIQIALYLKLCVDTLSFTVSVWLFARTGASDPLPPDASTIWYRDNRGSEPGIRIYWKYWGGPLSRFRGLVLYVLRVNQPLLALLSEATLVMGV